MAKTVSPVGGAKAVTAAGTGEKLVATSTLAAWVCIQAKEANTTAVFVGDSSVDKTSSPQITLDAGESLIIAPTEGFDLDLSTIYVDATTNGEGVDFLYLK